MTSTPALRLGSPGEIAAVVPYLCGFAPTESLVAISLRGRRRRIGLTLRADLTDDPALVRQVVQALGRDRAAECVLCVHTEAADEGRHPWAGLVEDVEAGLGRRGIAVHEALLVRSGRWWSYRCERGCCPSGGTPLDPGSPAVRRAASETAYEGRAVLGSRAELVASLQPRPPLGAAVARRAQEQARVRLGARQAVDPATCARQELARWEAALAAWQRRPAILPPSEVAALVAGLHDVRLRDEVASWYLSEPDALLGLLGQLCQGAVAPDDAPVCAVLAWAAYARGNGALALVAVQRALASCPGYALAELLLCAIDGVLPPSQVRGVLRRFG